MNKAELVSLVAEKSGLTKAVSEEALNAVVASITETLAKGESISLVGFGAFSVNARAARTCRNPKTGADLKVPASKAVKFKPGSHLKDVVNN